MGAGDMFEIGWTEILVIAVVAIVVFPSKDLPKLLRTTGQMIGRVRRMAGDFQSQFNAALREAEREVDLEDARKQIADFKSANPLSEVRNALDPLRKAGEDIKRDLTRTGPSTSAPSQLVAPPASGNGNPTLSPAPPVAVPPAEPGIAGPASPASPVPPASPSVPAPPAAAEAAAAAAQAAAASAPMAPPPSAPQPASAAIASVPANSAAEPVRAEPKSEPKIEGDAR